MSILMGILKRIWGYVRKYAVPAGAALGAVFVFLGLRRGKVPPDITAKTKELAVETKKAMTQAKQAIERADEVLGKSQEVIKHADDVVADVDKREAERQKRIRKLRGGGAGLTTIILATMVLVLTLILMPAVIHAQTPEPVVPDSYEDLKAAYLEQIQINAQWKAKYDACNAEWSQLYDEAKADRDLLKNEIERLKNHITLQDETIKYLRDTIASLNDTIASLNKWIQELYKTIGDLTKQGLEWSAGVVTKLTDGKVTVDGVQFGVVWKK